MQRFWRLRWQGGDSLAPVISNLRVVAVGDGLGQRVMLLQSEVTDAQGVTSVVYSTLPVPDLAQLTDLPGTVSQSGQTFSLPAGSLGEEIVSRFFRARASDAAGNTGHSSLTGFSSQIPTTLKPSILSPASPVREKLCASTAAASCKPSPSVPPVPAPSVATPTSASSSAAAPPSSSQPADGCLTSPAPRPPSDPSGSFSISAGIGDNGDIIVSNGNASGGGFFAPFWSNGPDFAPPPGWGWGFWDNEPYSLW